MSKFKITGYLKNQFRDFIDYAKSHKILVLPEYRIDGIAYTLIGWALIAIATVGFQSSIKEIPKHINLLIQFFSATLVLFSFTIWKGFSYLKVQELDKHFRKTRGEIPHLKASERISLIIIRSLIAIIGYQLYSLSRVQNIDIDNSALFGTHAFAYAVLVAVLLREKLHKIQWLGIGITILGVSVIYLIESLSDGFFNILPGLLEGLGASLALAIIILVNSVLVQHDPPLRIAFYQSFIGFLFFLLLNLVFYPETFKVLNGILNSEQTFNELIFSILSGMSYGIALLFFFRAFLFTEPIIIAALGYSLPLFVECTSYITNLEVPSLMTISVSLIIIFGSGILIYHEYENDKKRKKISSHGVYYIPNFLEKMMSTKKDFDLKLIEWTEYMSLMHEYNKLLFGFSDRIKETEIDKIEINKKEVLFFIKNSKIKMVTDGACRSAPFEILNFGNYEFEESKLLFSMIKDGETILDIGAHIGWFSINFALECSNSQIFAFEPVKQTYEYLSRNLKINRVKNVQSFNFGFSDREKMNDFYYFKGGSALASEKNLISYDKCEKTSVNLHKLDEFVRSKGIRSIGLIKCDVEGAELFVINGGMQTISDFFPLIYIELYEPWCKKFDYSANDVRNKLFKIGYDCYQEKNGKLQTVMNIDENSENYNYFFLHKEKQESLVKKLN